MVRILIFLLLSYWPFNSFVLGQGNLETEEEEESFEMVIQHFDELDRDWHGIEPTLDNYNGIHIYCSQESYKEIVMNVLERLHHYDTVIVNKVNDPHYLIPDRERKKVLKEIRKFEEEYSIPNFINQLDQECEDRKAIEREKKYTRRDFGEESYDGQKLVVEEEIKKYMSHITDKIDYIDKYLHHLHISEITK